MIFIVYIMYIVYSPYLWCIIYTCHVRFMCIHMFYIPAISHTVPVYIYIYIHIHASVWTLRPFTIFGDAVIPTV